MRFRILVCASIVAGLMTSEALAGCGLFGRKARVRYTVTQSCNVTTPSPQVATGENETTFLAALNAYRASMGRPPLTWDQSLASWAASNGAGHTVMAPGAGQCWSGVCSYSSSLTMWMNSPAHRNILMGAGSSIGAAITATGTTANVR